MLIKSKKIIAAITSVQNLPIYTKGDSLQYLSGS